MPPSLSEAIKAGSEKSGQMFNGFFSQEDGVSPTAAKPVVGLAAPPTMQTTKYMKKYLPVNNGTPVSNIYKVKSTFETLKVEYQYAASSVSVLHGFSCIYDACIPKDVQKSYDVYLEYYDNMVLFKAPLYSWVEAHNNGCWLPLHHPLVIEAQTMFRFMCRGNSIPCNYKSWTYDPVEQYNFIRQITIEFHISTKEPV